MPCARKEFGHMRLDSLCTYAYALENLEVIDTPVHILIHVVTMHEHKPI